MNKYIVHSFEHQYEGLYGMESYLMVKCDLKSAEEIARDESYAIMEDYSCIKEYIKEEAEDLFESCNGHTYQEILEQLYKDNVAYNIYVICSNCPFVEQQINKAIYCNPKEFVEQYCDLIISH